MTGNTLFVRPLVFALMIASGSVMAATSVPPKPKPAWMNTTLTPDQRADLVLRQMTLDEKIQLVHGVDQPDKGPYDAGFNFGAGYVPAIKRLGIPAINNADSAVGVALGAWQSRYATLLPSTLGAASSWNPSAAYRYGEVIGRELRDQGFDMSLAGGMNLAREPRDGRTFEFAGEDPLLAGTMTGNLVRGIQSRHVMGDLKHYAFNDQETGRTVYNAIIDKRAAHESDLLAFRIALDIGQPAAVMCAYMRVNGDYSCENHWLLSDALKRDAGFKGFVVSDWGATHSTVKSALAGLDQEMSGGEYFGKPLKQAVQSGAVPMARLDDMDHRILRSLFATGVVDDPPDQRQVIDPFRGRADAERIALESIVLLKNADHVLPLAANAQQSIALIGSHADVGVLSGGGSAQIDAPGGNAADPHPGFPHWNEEVYFPSSPLKSIRKQAPQASVAFDAGTDIAAAVALARKSQVAIVFVNQPMREGMDRPTLALPGNQNALVEAVAAANPHTIVVLETGGPVTMPWAGKVQGIVEAWYPGIGGAQALAKLLFGAANFSAKLPITFPDNVQQLPHPQIAGLTDELYRREAGRSGEFGIKGFDVDYNTAGAAVGYKWFELKHETPLFPFGFGLSYTTYAYSKLDVASDGSTATLTVSNTGPRAGEEIAEIYAVLPQASGESYKRLIGFQRVPLAAGASERVTIPLDKLCLSIYDTTKHAFVRLPGTYAVYAGPSSADTPLHAAFTLDHPG